MLLPWVLKKPAVRRQDPVIIIPVPGMVEEFPFLMMAEKPVKIICEAAHFLVSLNLEVAKTVPVCRDSLYGSF
jgi:hypothetical protein